MGARLVRHPLLTVVGPAVSMEAITSSAPADAGRGPLVLTPEHLVLGAGGDNEAVGQSYWSMWKYD